MLKCLKYTVKPTFTIVLDNKIVIKRLRGLPRRFFNINPLAPFLDINLSLYSGREKIAVSEAEKKADKKRSNITKKVLIHIFSYYPLLSTFLRYFSSSFLIS